MCLSNDRAQIESRRARGVSFDKLAKKYAPISKDSFYRHFKNGHCDPVAASKDLAIALVGEDVDLEQLRKDESDALLSHIKNLRTRLYLLMDKAENSDAHKIAIGVAARITAVLELEAKVLGEIGQHGTKIENNLVVSPDYLRLRAGLIRVVRAHPTVLPDMMALLREIETVEEPKEIEIISSSATSLAPCPDGSTPADTAVDSKLPSFPGGASV